MLSGFLIYSIGLLLLVITVVVVAIRMAKSKGRIEAEQVTKITATSEDCDKPTEPSSLPKVLAEAPMIPIKSATELNLEIVRSKFTPEDFTSLVTPVYTYIYESNRLISCSELLKFFPEGVARIKIYGTLTNSKKEGILDILEASNLLQRIEKQWVKGSYKV